jgi:hypothetical protein
MATIAKSQCGEPSHLEPTRSILIRELSRYKLFLRGPPSPFNFARDENTGSSATSCHYPSLSCFRSLRLSISDKGLGCVKTRRHSIAIELIKAASSEDRSCGTNLLFRQHRLQFRCLGHSHRQRDLAGTAPPRPHEALRPLLTLHSFRFVGLAFLVPGVVSPDLPAAFAEGASFSTTSIMLQAASASTKVPNGER